MDTNIQKSIRKIQIVPVSKLKPYENNPRNNDKAVPSIVESIKRYGFNVPITCDKNGVIATGHTRYKAALKLGLTEVPVIYLDDLSDAEIAAWRLVDNKTSEVATWDDDKLNIELLNLSNSGIDLTPFDFKLDDKTTAPIVEKETYEDTDFDYSEALKKKSRVKHGQVWKLGRHRLMCGDSCVVEDVKRLLNGQSVDLVLTDPPYGMKKESEGILNDNQNQKELAEFNKRWCAIAFTALKDNGSFYCWGTDLSLLNLYACILKPMIDENKITFRNLITWDKGTGQGQLSADFRSYAIADEKCLFVMGGVQGFNTNADNYFEGWEPIRSYLANEWAKVSPKNDWDKYLDNKMGKHYFTKSQWVLPTEENYKKLQAIGKSCGAFKREYEEIKREYYATRAYFNNTHDNFNNVWHFARVSTAEKAELDGFATPKPIALCTRAIKSSSRPGDIVLDLFGGSGSTLIASEQLDRSCLMMELSAKYCELIIRRWEKLTGQKADLLEN